MGKTYKKNKKHTLVPRRLPTLSSAAVTLKRPSRLGVHSGKRILALSFFMYLALIAGVLTENVLYYQSRQGSREEREATRSRKLLEDNLLQQASESEKFGDGLYKEFRGDPRYKRHLLPQALKQFREGLNYLTEFDDNRQALRLQRKIATIEGQLNKDDELPVSDFEAAPITYTIVNSTVAGTATDAETSAGNTEHGGVLTPAEAVEGATPAAADEPAAGDKP